MKPALLFFEVQTDCMHIIANIYSRTVKKCVGFGLTVHLSVCKCAWSEVSSGLWKKWIFFRCSPEERLSACITKCKIEYILKSIQVKHSPIYSSLGLSTFIYSNRYKAVREWQHYAANLNWLSKVCLMLHDRDNVGSCLAICLQMNKVILLV